LVETLIAAACKVNSTVFHTRCGGGTFRLRIKRG
jgi:hypothetical protein